ncbi:MAG TPA: tail fiber domain-containing protein, partial [Patescibacteria group bacterium]|nr:tail fiber domain-containing protein [Patescibacteria group bacterium]
ADQISRLLGGDSSGFDAFKRATGFDAAAETGSRGITGNAAARGLLRSGSTGARLMQFGNELQNQYSTNYLDKLMGLGNLGLGAGGLLAQAGQVQKSKKKGGLGSTLGGFGSLLSGGAAIAPALSDRRSKTNIEKIGELKNGLGVYKFNYKERLEFVPNIGVMADEVSAIQPEALGPIINGYQTVNYDKIEGWGGL